MDRYSQYCSGSQWEPEIKASRMPAVFIFERYTRLGALLLLLMACALGPVSCSDSNESSGDVPAAAVNPGAVPPLADDPELTLVSQRQLSPRLFELTMRTSALPEETKVRVLLPEGYELSNERFPVLYLLHGGLDDYTVWTNPDQGNAETATAGLPLIVVMPDAGPFGFYADWYNNGNFGLPRWETYHIRQLVPWIDANYRTIADRSGRAAAGSSMGGHGAFSYAARHPDRFGIAASFSGSVDNNNERLQSQLAPVAPLIFGAYATEEVRLRGSNAWDLAANFVNTDLSMYAGDGDGIDNESMVKEEAVALHDRLNKLYISHHWHAYGEGSHTWFYFSRDLTDWLPHLMDYFNARNTSVPTSFTYVSISPTYSVYDWSVAVDRPAIEFSALEVLGADRFRVTGSGIATVVTGALYIPGYEYTVSLTTPGGHSERQSAQADVQGRLTLSLDLGPGNPYQQYSPLAEQASNGGLAGADDLPFFVRGNGSNFLQSTVSIWQ